MEGTFARSAGRALLLSCGTALLLARAPRAGEFYAFVDGSCRVRSGLVASVGEERFVLWGLDGRLEELPREEVAGVFVFSVEGNPFPSMGRTEGLRRFMRRVALRDGGGFTGWPYKFVEDLVFFIGVEGRAHVISLEQVGGIRGLRDDEPTPPSAGRTGAPARIDLSAYHPRCFRSPPGGGRGGPKPHQIILDRIKVFEFFKSLGEGFDRVANFQERTGFYARPYLFGERRSRLGIYRFKHGEKEGREHRTFVLPVYYQWTKGHDFHFQSQTVLGGHFNPWTPFVEPMLGLSSDLKSHFFNAVFVGNMNGLSQGSAITTRGDVWPEAPRVTPNFNHLALMGVDRGPFSVSVGFVHPSWILSVGDELREVLATKGEPMVRVQFIRDRWRLRALYFRTSHGRAPHEQDGNMRALRGRSTDLSDEESRGEFSFKGTVLRVGLDLDVDADTSVGIDEVVAEGRYREDLDGRGNKMDFRHLYTQAYAQRTFGHYVFLKVVGNYYRYEYDHSFGGAAAPTKGSDTAVGLQLGLLF